MQPGVPHASSNLHWFKEGMEIMRKLIAAAAALALAMPVAMPIEAAQAQSHYKGKSTKGRTYYKKCRRSPGHESAAAGPRAGQACRTGGRPQTSGLRPGSSMDIAQAID